MTTHDSLFEYFHIFYVLKIRLNLFEISKQVLKSENELSGLKIDFKSGLHKVVQCACIQPYHMTNLNTHTRHHSVGSMFEINFIMSTFWGA